MNQANNLIVFGSLSVVSLLTERVTFAQTAEAIRPVSQPAGTLKVDVSHDRLSVYAIDAPIVKILEAIENQARITIESNLGTEAKITVRLDRVSLEDGLRQLAKNVSIFYAQDSTTKRRRIVGVILLAEGSVVSGQVKTASQLQRSSEPVAQQPKDSIPSVQPAPFKFDFDPSSPK